MKRFIGTNATPITKVLLRFFFFIVLSFLLTFCSCDVPVFLFKFCPPPTLKTSDTTYKSNFNTLLDSLSSNATSNPNNVYSKATVGRSSNAVYGLYYCRGDGTHDVCRDCALTAAQEMTQLCPNREDGYIWYDQCVFRYSNQPFFSTLSEQPLYYMTNSEDISVDATRFNLLVKETMTKAANEATSDSTRFATREAYFTQNTTLFCLAQCSPDLSENDCGTCLVDAIAGLSRCRSGKQGGRVVNPSCNVRFEIYPFYNVTASAPSPSPPPSNTTTSPSPPPYLHAPPHQSNINSITIPGKGQSSRKIVVIVVPVVAGVILFSLLLYRLLTRKKKQNQDTPQETGGSTINSAESLQFDFSTVLAATNNFADANKIGHGGFGGVFKGILPNGQEIAVKRLSENSGQGEEEFKNEVVLLAKLQHKNLVRLLGFCLEGEEKILIYELVHNRSLDYFLFDPEKCVKLDWGSRYNIIRGIARGLLYLHEDSRLRIIHRDLKASNILLDLEMNPQISDFGTARIIERDQTHEYTNRIIGTRGYMPPEYVMHGDFSIKSDVFSFGVLVLEIVSGKRSGNYLYQEDSVQDLGSYAWRHWVAGTAFELVDPVMRESCSRTEITRCIHIGLLCVQEVVADRPTMASVVLMLNGSITLPLPSQPIFRIEGKEMHEAESDQSKGSKLTPSITEFEPR